MCIMRTGMYNTSDVRRIRFFFFRLHAAARYLCAHPLSCAAVVLSNYFTQLANASFEGGDPRFLTAEVFLFLFCFCFVFINMSGIFCCRLLEYWFRFVFCFCFVCVWSPFFGTQRYLLIVHVRNIGSWVLPSVHTPDRSDRSRSISSRS